MATTDRRSAPLSEVELAAWRGMLEAHAGVIPRLDAEMRAEHGISVSAYEVLMFLGDAPGRRLRMSDIAERVLLSRSGCTRLVDRLVTLGYVERSRSDADGRGTDVELTAAGGEKLKAARMTHRSGIRRFFLDRLAAEDLSALADVWRRFAATSRAGAPPAERRSRRPPDRR